MSEYNENESNEKWTDVVLPEANDTAESIIDILIENLMLHFNEIKLNKKVIPFVLKYVTRSMNHLVSVRRLLLI